MNKSDWTHLLRLLSMIIVADGKVYQEEVEVFVNSCTILREKISPDMFMTRKMATDWFHLHREEIERSIEINGITKAMTSTIYDLRAIDETDALVDAMQAISLADGFAHSQEQRIIRKAIEIWQS